MGGDKILLFDLECCINTLLSHCRLLPLSSLLLLLLLLLLFLEMLMNVLKILINNPFK